MKPATRQLLTCQWRRPLFAGAMMAIVTALTGCALQGPEAMRGSRLEYNDALQRSEQRELLLNLVRLRYTDSPEFLAVSGIAAQMSFEAQASIGGEFGEVEDAPSAFISPGASVGYSETPTVTFTPRRDQAFTRQLVSPVDLDSVYLLTRYGWRVDRVLRLVVRDLNGVRNDISRESNEGSAAERLRAFGALANRLEAYRASGLITIALEQRAKALSPPLPSGSLGPANVVEASASGYRLEPLADDPSRYVLVADAVHHVLRVDERAWQEPSFVASASTLGLTPGRTRYDIDPGSVTSDTADDRLRLSTRSVLGAMAYLSNAVSIPEAHAERRIATAAGPIQQSLNDLLVVHVSATPVDAYLSVPYRDHWFYVDEADLSTKRTLGLLSALTRLTISAGGAQNVPVLTLPVTR